MNSNELMYYFKGFFELSNEPPTREQWGKIRSHVLDAYPVVAQNAPQGSSAPPFPQFLLDRAKLPGTDCGCGGATPAGQSRVEGG